MRGRNLVAFHKSSASRVGFVLEILPLLGEPHFVCFVPIARDKAISVSAPNSSSQARRVRTRNPFHGLLADPDFAPLRFQLIRLPTNFLKVPSLLHSLKRCSLAAAPRSSFRPRRKISLPRSKVGLLRDRRAAGLTFSRPFVRPSGRGKAFGLPF